MAKPHKTRKQQARISFSPLPSTSPAAKDYHEQIQNRAAAVRYETNSSSPLKRKFVDLSSPDRDAEASLPTPDTPNNIPVKASSSKHKLKRVRQQRLDLSAFTIPAQLMSSPAVATPAAAEQSSDSDDAPRRSGKKRRVQSGFMSSGRARRSQHQINLEPVTSSMAPVSSPLNALQDSESDGDDMPTTAGTRKRGRAARQPSPSPSIEAPSESDDDVEIIDAPEPATPDDDEDSDLPVTTPKRRLLKRRKKTLSDPDMTQQDREDLDEDLDFLQPSEDDIPKLSKNTQSAKKNARMAALDALKQKRTGATQVVFDETPEPDEEGDDDDEDELAYNGPPASSRAMFQADDADDDFLDDGVDGELGAPEEVPIEFSKYASMKPKELFQYAIEWMVQKKINPAFEINNALYDLTFRKLNDEVAGLVSSKYSSSAWTADFTLALRARPNIAIDEIGPGMGGEHCDACNRSNHSAAFLIQFHGTPYHQDTLDDVEAGDDSSDTDDDNDDKACYDSHKKQIPPASKTYQVGRFCGANAETAHELAHWKWSLYAWVVKWIDEENFNTPAKIVERDSWSTKKRRKEASKIADRMHETGVTKRLWKEFTDIITRAREGTQGRWR